MSVPEIRVRPCNDRQPATDGDWVLYWMIAARRPGWNFGLQRAAEWCERLGRPLLVLEALRCDYPWASDRLHRFVVDGMRDNARALTDRRIAYYPYLEPEADAGSGLLESLAERACVVVTDEYPTFFLPRMVAAAAERLPVALEAVDSNGLLPLTASDKAYSRAYGFRRFLQATLPEHLEDGPRADPVGDVEAARSGHRSWGLAARLGELGLPEEQLQRWPVAFDDPDDEVDLSALPIDHGVAEVPRTGGAEAGARRLRDFVAEDLEAYGEGRNDPSDDRSSRLSAWLHFGHVGAHQALEAVADAEGWSPEDVSGDASGNRSGWWRMGDGAEAFLDELVTWRELGFNNCWHRADYDRYEGLPEWAQETLSEHAGDERPYVYSVEEFEEARTHDDLWNAAQRQLLTEGRIHNYLRMLWGKKILHWSESPPVAAEIMVELNNKYAVDGRDPNSWSGIFWCLGRHDRPWGPEREVFGKVRYMTCRNTRRKLSVDGYLERYGEPGD